LVSVTACGALIVLCGCVANVRDEGAAWAMGARYLIATLAGLLVVISFVSPAPTP
jgi:hypothetical protein